MSKLIDGQAAIDALCDNCDNMQAVCPHYPCKQYTAIEALPHAQPDIPTNTPNTPTNTPTDCISRQAVYDALITEPLKWDDSSVWESARCHQWMMDMDVIKALPSVMPDIIRCKDCFYGYCEVWLTGGGEAASYGYCGRTNLRVLPYDF